MNTSSQPVVIGLDPGQRWIGLAARTGHALLGHAVLDRHDVTPPTVLAAGTDPLLLDRWLGTVLHALADVVAGSIDLVGRVDLVAVELTQPPTGFAKGKRAPIDPGPIMDTAQVGGAAIGWATAAAIPSRLVVPDRHGTVDLPPGTPARVARAALEQSYPAELIGDRETSGRGKSPRQHARAAWDVAGAGATLLRTQRTA